MTRNNRLTRRDWMKAAGVAALAGRGRAAANAILFDGRTLDGWTQFENSWISLSSGSIVDAAAFARRIANGQDAISVFLRNGMPEALKSEVAAYSAENPNAKSVVSAVVKYINQTLEGPSLIREVRVTEKDLRPETRRLLQRKPRGVDLIRLNKAVLEDLYAQELARSATAGWVVKNGAMASTGSGRGVIYTNRDFTSFRLTFTMRHVSGNPDHQACILIFCQRPKRGEKPLDALGGIQFQVPNGGHWDYRPGKNNAGGDAFASLSRVHFDVHEWSSVEILADPVNGTARMAVAQPPGSKPIEVLSFRDPSAGRFGPIAWQMHNAGLFDEYRQVEIEKKGSK